MKNIILTAALLLVTGLSYAQDNGGRDVIIGDTIVLDYELPSDKDNVVIATTEIRLKPGFRARNDDATSTSLGIDDLAVVPPESGLTGGSVSNNQGGVVGTLGGTVDVSSLGGASYAIPIEVPSGINGMHPRLSVAYNSQSGEGILGYGWCLTGISSITRTGSTLYHDGRMTAADFSGSDRFLLDGQRLMEVSGDKGGYVEYKTEQDEFSKIVFHKDGDEFTRCEVWQENGCTVYYGLEDDSDNSRLMTSDGEHVMKWMVSRVEDRNGNAMTYDYDNNPKTGEIYISRIHYTYNDKAKIDAEFEVSFSYDERKLPDYSYIGGYKTQSTKILKEIKATRSGSEIVTYGFSYNKFIDGLSYILRNVSMSKDGTHVNPTKVYWEMNDSGDGYNTLSEVEIDTAILKKMTFQGDFNGDGYTDMLTVPYRKDNWHPTMDIHLNNRSGGFLPSSVSGFVLPDSLEWVHVADLNGDGLDDVIVQTEAIGGRKCTTTLTIYETRCDGSGLHLEQVYSEEGHARLLIKTGDFIGVGKANLLAIPLYDDFLNLNEEWIDVIYYDEGYSRMVFPCDFDFVTDEAITQADDYDGDGVTELLVYDDLANGHNSVMLSFDSGNGDITVEETPLKNIDGITALYSGDFNGDGMADVLYYVPKGFKRNVCVMLSKGTGFASQIYIKENQASQMAFPAMSLYNYSFENIDPDMSCGISVTDIDGDGRCDIVSYSDKRTVFYRNFSLHDREFKTVCEKDKDEARFLNQYFAMGNFMGRDNLSFVSTKESQYGKAYISWFRSVAEFLSVNKITDGMGGVTEIRYDYLVPGSGIYTFRNTKVGDVRSMPVPVLAMRSNTKTQGRVSVTTEYSYADAMFHRTGKGFLGFGNVKTWTSVSGCRTRLQSCNYGLGAVGGNTVMIPLNDTTYVYSEGRQVASESHEYRLTDIRNSLNPLVMRPAMSRYVTKAFDVDNSGGVLSCTIEEYTYSYSKDLSYEHTYHCISTVTGTDSGDCGSAGSCGHVTVAAASSTRRPYATTMSMMSSAMSSGKQHRRRTERMARLRFRWRTNMTKRAGTSSRRRRTRTVWDTPSHTNMTCVTG